MRTNLCVFSRLLKMYLTVNFIFCAVFLIWIRVYYLFFGKVQHLWTFQACNFIKKETLAHLLYCKFCEISKNTLSYRTPLVAASNISLCVFQGPYLLSFIRIRRIIFYRNIQYDKIWLDLFSGSGKCYYTFLDVIIIWRILPETTELFQSGIGGQKLFRS